MLQTLFKPLGARQRFDRYGNISHTVGPIPSMYILALVFALALRSQDVRGSYPAVNPTFKLSFLFFPLFPNSLIIHKGRIYTPPAAKVISYIRTYNMRGISWSPPL